MVLLALGLVLVGDLLPRGVGRSQPRRLAYRLAPLLSGAVRLGAWANDLLPDQEVEEEEEPPPAEEEEERRLISSVLEFSDTIVREVMVPRTDMVTVRLDASLTDLLGLITEHGYSRYPVVDPRSEDIVGLVIARDLLPLLAGGERPATIAALMRPVDFVPETKRVSDLLREMQVSKTHLAVVSDEFGDVAGLVSIEDLLEELVGEIVDEYDEEVPLVRASGASSWLVDGRAGVDVLAEVVRTALPDDDWDTVGGLVLGLAGRLPEEDEEVAFGDLTFRVVRLQGRRVAEVEVRKMERVASDERR
jgi:CBS domain containing-hemolysin-like protein